jgi:hypothetical protein
MTIKSYLSTLTKEELVGELSNICNTHLDIKDHFVHQFIPDKKKYEADCSKKIRKAFLRDKEHAYNNALEIMNEFLYFFPSEQQSTGIKFCYIEEAIQYSLTTTGLKKTFYNTILEYFTDICKTQTFKRESTEEKRRCKNIIQRLKGKNWPFTFDLKEIYKQHVDYKRLGKA